MLFFIWFDRLKQHSHDVKFSFNGNVDYCRKISYFLRKNPYFEELQLENTSSNVSDFLQMNSAWYIFKTHARDFDSYLRFLGNLENKTGTLVVTRYFYFSNHLKSDKESWKSRARVFKFYQVIFIYKYIRWCLLDLKLVKSLICFHKRPGFSVNINVSVKKCDFEFFLFFYYHIG